MKIALLLGIVLVAPFIAIASHRPTHNDYPHNYVIYDDSPYRVQSESSRPEWMDEDEIWHPSEDYKTEAELLRCEYVQRI